MNTQSSLYRELNDIELNLIIENNFGKGNIFKSKLLSGGLFNTTYHITFLLSQKEMVLRVGPVNRHLILPFEDNLMNAEKYVYRLLQNNKIPCSKVIVCDTQRKIIDRDYMFVEFIPSVPLSELTATENTLTALYKQIGFYTSKLHNITGLQFGRISQIIQGHEYSSWSTYLEDEISQWKEKVVNTELFSVLELSLVDKVFQKHKVLLDEIKTPYLIHADLWAGNVLIQKTDNEYIVAAIIDADRAIYGDVDFEFASQWIINEAFLKGYGSNLKLDVNSTTRRMIYKLIYNLIDSYVWLVEYNNPTNSDENKKSAMQLIKQLI